MATVEFDIKDFQELVGKKISIKEMQEKIPMLGVGWDGNTDKSFTIEVEPNRPDLLSVEGLARNMKGILNIETGPIHYKLKNSGETLTAKESIKGIREHIVMGIVKNIKITEPLLKSIIQIQEKLHLTHGRKRKKVAIGIHDYDKVKGPFTYECVTPESISFVPLDENEEMNMRVILDKHPKGKEYKHLVEHHEKYPVITDKDNNVLSFPPIINGELTRVTEKTKNLIIDITGTDKIAINQALNILMTLFHERGGELYYVKNNNQINPDLSYTYMDLDINYANKISGLNLSIKEYKNLLERMRYDVKEKSDSELSVGIPPYRTDIMHQYDIIEDAIIAYGYDNVETEELTSFTEAGITQKEKMTNKLRDLMIGFGLQELLTFALTSKNKIYKKMNIEEQPTVEMENALNTEYSCLRTWLLPGLMETLSINTNKPYPQKLFEIDDCSIIDAKEDTGSKDQRKLAIAIADTKANYTIIKSILDSIKELLGLNLTLNEANHGTFINGRCASISLGNKEIGVIGEVHPQVLENFGIEVPVAALELNLEDIVKNNNSN